MLSSHNGNGDGLGRGPDSLDIKSNNATDNMHTTTIHTITSSIATTSATSTTAIAIATVTPLPLSSSSSSHSSSSTTTDGGVTTPSQSTQPISSSSTTVVSSTRATPPGPSIVEFICLFELEREPFKHTTGLSSLHANANANHSCDTTYYRYKLHIIGRSNSQFERRVIISPTITKQLQERYCTS
jgi:hypothetical protein